LLPFGGLAYAIANNRKVTATTKASARWAASNKPISVNTSLGVGQSPVAEDARRLLADGRHIERIDALMTLPPWTRTT